MTLILKAAFNWDSIVVFDEYTTSPTVSLVISINAGLAITFLYSKQGLIINLYFLFLIASIVFLTNKSF